jgi:hypothetical protein
MTGGEDIREAPKESRKKKGGLKAAVSMEPQKKVV